MYFSTNIFLVLATVLALSNCLWADGFGDQKKLQNQPCEGRPWVKADTINATELHTITKDLIPNVSENGTRSVLGLMPDNIPFSPRPKIHLIKDREFDKLINLGLNNTALFLRKVVLNHRSYPWCTIGKIATYDGAGTFLRSCSGTVVGRNLMLTASHCVPWSQPDGQWSMEFIPSFNGDDTANPRPFGTVFATRCRGVVNTDDVTGLDYVICQLTEPIGDRVGYMGWEASTGDDFYLNGLWTSVGYPDGPHEGRVPMVEDRIALDDVDDEGSDGKELESYVFHSHGWSGGPLFAVTEGVPRVVGVLSGFEKEFSFWDFFVADHSVSAGGMHMAQLIAYGRANWGP